MTLRLQQNRPGFLSYFNTIEYNGIETPNLMARAVLSKLALDNEALYFTYTLDTTETRPDIFAARYYGNSRLDWLVVLVNQMDDLLFQWPMNEVAFKNYIDSKYGSVAEAAAELLYYEVNPRDNISTAAYAVLDPTLKRYWQAVYNDTSNVIYYSFAKKDLQISIEGYNALDTTEKTYWQAVSALTKEQTDNDNRRTIKVLNKIYAGDVVNSLRKVFA